MEIRVIVYANEVAKNDKKSLFERLVVWSSDIVFPYASFDSVMRICFGNKCVVCFEQSVL